ncbi:MAG: cytochrome c [Bacteroidia bacterium]
MNLLTNRIFLGGGYLLICLLFSSCKNNGVFSEKITYADHIAPIIYKNCSSCHRPGEAGPFNLLSYQDVRSRAALIKFVTTTRYMPPWPADANYSHFIDEKVLTDDEIELITKWVDEGCMLGDSTKIPQVPQFTNGSQLGKPDLVINYKDAFRIKGNFKDLFLLMRVPYEIPNDTFISAIEVVPGNRKLVHHVNAQLLSYDYNKRKDVFRGNTVVDIDSFPDKLSAYKALDLANDDGITFPALTYSVTNYLPGVTPPIYPEGIGGFKLARKGALFLKDIHYGPSRVDTIDNTTFNVFYSKTAPLRPTREFQMGTFGVSPIVPPLVVPPDTVMTFRSDYRVPEDISILTLNPHMHLLGKTFLAYALSPVGDTIPLIRINKWDFRWQYFYTFKKMVKIPKGSIIHIEGVFDNTKQNPSNPFSPPRLIAEREGSMRTSDEMFQFIVTYLPYQAGDENMSLEGTRK